MPSVVGVLLDRLLGLAPADSPRVVVRRDIRIPMPDGVELLADHYRPAGAGSPPWPAVLIRTPYGHRTPLGRLFGSVLARRGLQVVVQSVRGTFGSGGEFWPFHSEQEDGLATAAWLREQPWCDGRLATAGPSYLGYTQWALGPYLDPPLEAMCLSVTRSDFAGTFYPGGSVSLQDLLSWSALIGRQEGRRLGGMLPDPRQLARTARAMSTLPLRDADVAAISHPVRFWQDVTGHADPGDDFWAAADHRGGRATLTTPVSMVTGWYDLFLPGQLADFTALAAAGRSTRITIGPWSHADPAALRAAVADSASWLAGHLKGETSELHQSPVRLYLQHAGRWLDFPQWPPADAQATRIHLQPAGGLRWDAPDSGEPDSFVFDPADPTPSVGGPLLGGKAKQRDNRKVEARPDVLTFTGDRLERHLDLAGEVAATIYLRTEPGHADLFVRLCDVDPAGASRNVCDGILRLRPGGAGTGGPASGDVVAAEVEMYPTGYRFRRGHRLRVQVTLGAFPRFARNHGTGDRVADAIKTRRCRCEIWHDAGHPSHLVLPVLSGAGPGG
jgi:putative CocE/NonD family hydrolase